MKRTTFFTIILITLYFLAIAASALVQAAPGDLDPTFQTRIEARANISSLVQPDGKIIVWGDFDRYNDVPRNQVARLNADGSLDTSFNAAPLLKEFGDLRPMLYKAVVQTDGKVVICGQFSRVGGQTRTRIARLNADGSLDTSFNPGTGISGNNFDDNLYAFAMAITAEGKILVGGFFQLYNDAPAYDLVRINSDGSLDTSFNAGNGASGTGAVLTVTLDQNGMVYVGGYFAAISDVSRLGFARLFPNGTLDNSYNSGTTGPSGIPFGEVSNIKPLPDGKAIIVGNFSRFLVNGIQTASRRGVARLNPDGRVDETFNSGLQVTAGTDAAIQPDGKIIVASLVGLKRFLPTGDFDNDYYRFGYVNGNIRSLTLLADGRVVFSGNFTRNYANMEEFGGERLLYRNGIGRLTADGYPDSTFNQGLGAIKEQTVPATTVSAIKVAPDGKIYISGDFSVVNGNGRRHLARLKADGTLDETFNPARELIDPVTPAGQSDKINTIALQPDGKIIVGGQFETYSAEGNGSFRPEGLARFNANGEIDTSFQVTLGGFPYASEVQPDGKIIVGGFIPNFQGYGYNHIGRFNADGTADGTYNAGTGTNGLVSAIARQPDGKILIAGDFTQFNGSPRGRIARLNADGSLDQTFLTANAANNSVLSMVLQPDGKVVIGGTFTTFNGVQRSRIARLNANGTLDETFPNNGGADAAVNALALQPDGKIVAVGRFNFFNDTVHRSIARLNQDGSIDASLESPVGAIGAPTAVALQRDNKILVGGEFTSFGGQEKLRLMRLQNNLAPTAATVSVTGRVLTPRGGGLTRASVRMIDARGTAHYATTSAFGYYRFDGVAAGETYVFEVVSKRYRFAPQIVTVNEDLAEMNFTAAQE